MDPTAFVNTSGLLNKLKKEELPCGSNLLIGMKLLTKMTIMRGAGKTRLRLAQYFQKANNRAEYGLPSRSEISGWVTQLRLMSDQVMHGGVHVDSLTGDLSLNVHRIAFRRVVLVDGESAGKRRAIPAKGNFFANVG